MSTVFQPQYTYKNGQAMIKLTRLDGENFVLNAEMIMYVESRPDTFVTLTNGERVIVSESMDQVIQLVVAYQRSKYLIPPPGGSGWKTS